MAEDKIPKKPEPQDAKADKAEKAIAELRKIAAEIAGNGETAKTRDCAAFFAEAIDSVLKGTKPNYERFNIRFKKTKK